LDDNLALRNHNEALYAAVLVNVAENRDVLLAVFDDAVFLSSAPPLDGFDAIAGFCGA
jgi:hypothetical protein